MRGGRAALLAISPLVLNMTRTVFAGSDEPVGEIALPEPDLTGKTTLEATLARRRSVRNFSQAALTLAEISQLLWAGQGITSPSGYRTAPSAGALYPLQLYVATGRVESLPAGVFGYEPSKHVLRRAGQGDRRDRVARAALSQTWIGDSGAIVAVAAIMRRTTRKYGERGRRYVYMEAGHVAQNICLQAVALDLGATPVGAFRDDEIRRALDMAPDAEPLYLLPIGRRRPGR